MIDNKYVSPTEGASLHAYTDDMTNGRSVDEVKRPNATGDDDVIVEFEGAGWCPTDDHIIEWMRNQYVPQPLPMTPGDENAGTVVDAGPGIDLVSEGDPVICHPVRTCGTCRSCRLGETMCCEPDAFNGLPIDYGFRRSVPRASAR